MTSAKFGRFTMMVVETIDEMSNEPFIPASSITMACEMSGFCDNMEAFDMLQKLNDIKVIKYTGSHTIEKGEDFEKMKALLARLKDQIAKEPK